MVPKRTLAEWLLEARWRIVIAPVLPIAWLVCLPFEGQRFTIKEGAESIVEFWQHETKLERYAAYLAARKNPR